MSTLQGTAGYCYLRFEVFTAVTMKNAVFWDTEPRSYLVGHTMSKLQGTVGYCYLRFEVFTAVTTKNAVFRDRERSSYLTGDTLRLLYRAQPDNAM
jgi:hypothetical protein